MGNNLTVTGNVTIGGTLVVTGATNLGAAADTVLVTNFNADKLDDADLSTDGTLAANSDVLVPSQKAVKTYVGTVDAARKTYVDGADALKANDNAVVKLTGNQNVAGIKTFASPPAFGFTPADGTEQIYASDAEKSQASDTYIKMKEIFMPFAGTVNAYFEAKGGNPTYPTYARIYVNGAAVGTERTVVSDTYTPYSEAISVAQGDRLQVYGKRSASGTGYVRYFRVRCSTNLSGTIYPMLNTVNLD